MPTYQGITEARLRARRIRETHTEFKLDRIRLEESQRVIRRALQSTSANEFVSTEVLA
jgi:hypothetical protein